MVLVLFVPRMIVAQENESETDIMLQMLDSLEDFSALVKDPEIAQTEGRKLGQVHLSANRRVVFAIDVGVYENSPGWRDVIQSFIEQVHLRLPDVPLYIYAGAGTSLRPFETYELYRFVREMLGTSYAKYGTDVYRCEGAYVVGTMVKQAGSLPTGVCHFRDEIPNGADAISALRSVILNDFFPEMDL
jgi:hypothetical protein